MKKQQEKNKIKKLIIPAAGWGTRFLPMTKVIPKELVPILNKPSLDLLVEEAIAANIEEVVLVISTRKHQIMDYFQTNKDLENELKKKNKIKLLKKVEQTNKETIIRVVYQYEQLGLAHAILTGAKFFYNEPFAVILGDDLIKAKTPAIKQLMNFYEKKPYSILGVQSVEKDKIPLYGIVQAKNPEEKNNNFFEISRAVEKPKQEHAPSNKAISGRYIFNYSIVDFLEKATLKHKKEKKNNEIELADVLVEYMKHEPVFAYEFSGTRFDLGSIEGFAKATISYSLEHPDIKNEIKRYLKEEICKEI